VSELDRDNKADKVTSTLSAVPKLISCVASEAGVPLTAIATSYP
jgi:hypothetical protein